jgi:hypothetical protein
MIMKLFEFKVVFKCGTTVQERSFYVLANDATYASTALSVELDSNYDDLDYFVLHAEHMVVV